MRAILLVREDGITDNKNLYLERNRIAFFQPPQRQRIHLVVNQFPHDIGSMRYSPRYLLQTG